MSAPIEYTGVQEVRGPLLVVGDVEGVGWDEVAEIRLPSGEVRHGVVIDVERDLAVVEVLEGTGGLGTRRRARRLQRLADADTRRRANGSAGSATAAASRWTVGRRSSASDAGHRRGRRSTPRARAAPGEAVLTGISAIDGLATLVRGQKLPIFSVGGLPHLDLAAQIAAQARAGEEPFAVVFAAIGMTHADAAEVGATLAARSAGGDLVVLLNTADDPLVERIVTPQIALTIAEDLAFECDRHVLVVLADLTSYCEALREVAAGRGEIPSRRGYPGHLYSDLASLLERAGRIKGRPGSVTQLPVLTMPAGDINHPVPDTTGYITEGQIVLSPELHAPASTRRSTRSARCRG